VGKALKRIVKIGMVRSRYIHILLAISLFTLSPIECEKIRYSVESSILGKVAHIDFDSSRDKRGYRVVLEAKTEGVAALMTRNRRDRYICEGNISGAEYISRSFVVRRKSDTKKEIDEYIVDRSRLELSKRRTRYKHSSPRTKSKLLDYYTDQDLCTIYANVLPLAIEESAGKVFSVYSAGVEKAGGKVEIYRDSKNAGRDGEMTFIVKIPGEILGKKGRSIRLVTDRNLTLLKAELSPLPIVGTITVKRH